jgi:integrase
MIPGWPYPVVAALQPGRDLVDGGAGRLRMGLDDDQTEVTSRQVCEVLSRLVAAGNWREDDLAIVVVFDAGHDVTRLSDLPVELLTLRSGYPLAERLAARIETALAEQEAGDNPLGLVFPSPKGRHLRSSNFCRNVLQPAYFAAGWRDAAGSGRWTWHSLRHVFCTTALFTWKLDAPDVSCIAGHANVRTTLLMYVGTVAGVLDRARQATA